MCSSGIRVVIGTIIMYANIPPKFGLLCGQGSVVVESGRASRADDAIAKPEIGERESKTAACPSCSWSKHGDARGMMPKAERASRVPRARPDAHLIIQIAAQSIFTHVRR